MKRILTIICYIFLFSNIIAQTNIQVGTTYDSKDQENPIYSVKTYSYTQQIYLASEINFTGKIQSISIFYKSGPLDNSDNVDIYIGHTSKTYFSSDSDFEPVTNLTKVYSGTFTHPSGAAWINFDITDFDYNGTDNLIIAFDENASGKSTASVYYAKNKADNQIHCILSVNPYYNVDPASPTSNNNLFYKYVGKPSIIFTFETQLNGSGASGDPYLISSLDDLNWVSQNSDQWDKYYSQTANITASSTSTWNNGAGFSPIGNSTTNFTGTYNGNGHTIDGLFINRSTTDNIGLFGRTSGATIDNLGLTNVNITGKSQVGALVGWNANTTVNQSFSTGSITGSGYTIGGLFGYNVNATAVSNSFSTASVTGTGSPTNSWSGGLIGYNAGSTVSYSYSTGSVSGSGAHVNGFVGYNNNGAISYSFWDVETDGITGNSSGDNNSGAIGKTTSEMKTYSTFNSAGWDLRGETANGTSDNWNIGNSRNSGYPYLDWQYPSDYDPSIVPLPVELNSFTAASMSSAAVKLNWTTATEVNNYGFEVERQFAVNNNPLLVWETIGFVEGHGNSNSPKNYSFSDSEALEGTVQYRLKQIDIDGNFEYSDVVEIALSLPTEYNLAQNYPNPFNPTTKIEFSLPSENNVEIRIYNLLGSEITTLLNEKKKAGNHFVVFNGSYFSSGVYFYKIVSGNFSAIRKLTLLK